MKTFVNTFVRTYVITAGITAGVWTTVAALRFVEGLWFPAETEVEAAFDADQEEIKKIRRLFREDKSVDEISEEMHLPPNYIRGVLHSYA